MGGAADGVVPLTVPGGIVSCQRPQGCKDGINCDVAGKCLLAGLRHKTGQAEREDAGEQDAI